MPAPFSCDFPILDVGSCRSMTRAATVGSTTRGTVKVCPYRWLNRTARSRASSTCCRWSSPTGTSAASYARMSAAISTGYVSNDSRTPSPAAWARAAFSLYWIIRRSSPSVAVHSSR